MKHTFDIAQKMYSVLYCLAYTADDDTESKQSKRPVLRFPVVLLFLLKLFSSQIFCILMYLHKIANVMIIDKTYAGA